MKIIVILIYLILNMKIFKIELKTREVERFKYKTTIVGYDKIEKCLEIFKKD
jgi:hypothetical protein